MNNRFGGFMNILILEDNLYMSEVMEQDMEEYFNNHNIDVDIIVCNGIYEANMAIENQEYDYIISDLNMNPDGLDEYLYCDTMGALLTGWVWVKNYIFKNNSKSFVVFYSDFSEELKHIDEYKEYSDKSLLINKSEKSIEDICELILKKHCDFTNE